MAQGLVDGILGMFGGFASTPLGKEIIVFVVSLLPIL